VKHGGGYTSSGGGWSSWFGLGGGNRSTTGSSSTAASAAPPADGGCPIKHDAGAAGGAPMPFAGAAAPATAAPASVEEAASHPQMPRPDQRIPLSTRRVVSTIPRADELRDPLENRAANANANANGNAESKAEKKASTCAPHQPPEHTKWVYPSEQQFYNALRRKGWQPEESTIPDVVRIHNAVNERGWSEVRKWEAMRGNDSPRLVRFMGRPKDLSPRAWFNSRILWYHEPFDRHDWYVDGGEDIPEAASGGTGGSGDAKPKEEPRRYVIDFYSGDDGGFASPASSSSGDARGPHRPPSMYIDVRPALDAPDAAIDRVKMFVRDAFPGLSAAFGLEDTGSTSEERK
jgi:cytochrome c heme-lyase